MINFSTEFPIADKNSVSDVLKLALKSISTSPHTRLNSDQFPEIPTDSEVRIANAQESVALGSAKLGDFEIGGVRYIRSESTNLEWTITTVVTKKPSLTLLSIQVACEALSTAARLPPPKKPYFIKQALAELSGGMDGEIPVTNQPIYLTEAEIEIAAALISGTGANRLPIVYVSARDDGAHSIVPELMAQWVAGMAHVVVEPSKTFSLHLKDLVSARNVFGGTVGVYWPESNARKAYFLSNDFSTADALQTVIARDIRVALANRRPTPDCTWLSLTESISKCRYENLKSAGSTELTKYIDAFDSDLKAKEERITEAEAEIERLNSEIRRLTLVQSTSIQGLLQPGLEANLYSNEISDIVLEALVSATRTIEPTSRRAHVISDLLAHNQLVGQSQKLRDEVKALFKAYTNMDARTKSELARLGFAISDGGKHYKAIYRGDSRYTFAISKTGSDHRGGKNMASTINKTLF